MSSQKPYVSVIVAVFNVEQYIAQCCHSLFAQTLDNIEFVFIDDCSPDHSMEIMRSILKEYPYRASQVRIIEHKTNKGVSKTREEGVNAATGEYIIHCDPDDWIELDMYERLYEKAMAEDADIVLCNLWYHYFNDPTPYYGTEKPKELTSRSLLASCLGRQHPLMNCYLCNKLIKASLYQNVKWPEKISCSEDSIVCAQIMRDPSLVISHINAAFYHYYIKETSLSHRSNTKQDIENDYAVIGILASHLCESGDKDLYHIWQGSIAGLMIGTLKASERYFSNKEYTAKYKRYRGDIWKSAAWSMENKILLFCATYNYYIAYTLYKMGLGIKQFLRQVKSK